jgi:hypothetical protein
MSLFCLVHGSTQDASGWARRADEPEASAARHAQAIAEALPNFNEAPIVVAHSVSGIFLPLLPAHCPVSRMVFLAAFVPEIGKSPTQQLQANPEMFWPDWIGKDPTKDDAVAVHYLFHDCDPATAAWALTTRRLMHARHALSETCHLRSWPDVPVSYILCREDRTLHPDFWREQVRKQLGIDPIEVAGGHCPHVSHPRELADVLSRLA